MVDGEVAVEFKVQKDRGLVEKGQGVFIPQRERSLSDPKPYAWTDPPKD